MHGLVLRTSACDVGVYRLLYFLTLTQVLELRSEKVEVYRIRMVEVVDPFLLLSEVAPCSMSPEESPQRFPEAAL